MAKFPCPCCGQPVTQSIDPYRLVDHLRTTGVQRAVLRILAANFRRDVGTALIADCVYAGTSDGGPMTAVAGIAVHAHHLRKILAPYGLTIIGSGRGRRGGGQFRLDWIDGPVMSMRQMPNDIFVVGDQM